jgi:DNA-binding CsgD family transcriptional regulator
VIQGLRCSGLISLCLGNYQDALAFYEEAISEAKKLGAKMAIARSLVGLAQVVAVQGYLVWAVLLLGVAESLHEAMGTRKTPAERTTSEQVLATAHTQLGEKIVAAAWAQGRMMTLDQALAAKEVTPKVDEAGAAESLPASPTGRNSELAIKGDAAPTYPYGLTQREVEVLRLLTTGLSNTQMAEQLVISRRTVNAHLRSIYNKLDVTTRTAATRYAFDNHLV